MHDFSKVLQHVNEYNFFVPRPKLTNDIGRWLDHVLTWYYRPKFHINHDIYLHYGETIFLWTLSKILFESCLQTFFKTSMKWISYQISTSYNELYLFNRGNFWKGKKERERERESERKNFEINLNIFISVNVKCK